MKISSFCAIALLVLAIGCGTEVETKVAKSSGDENQPIAATEQEADAGSKTEATYTSNRGDDSDASKAANNEKPSAKSALASALTAAKADDKKLLVHFGSPG